ncbi:hypothetical protein ElyMa_005989500 [Elysia marginata]|uniref:L1 transposable element RRM domain-containing protein n=1 Tax=Elysia marginata TaxID=1093978 RepID=A0AAV4GE84_9GAST|nr:hypothetical protein ElyMa_005989500 [Elysia marginata]
MKEMMSEVKEIGRTVKSIEEKVEKHEGILSSLSEKVEKSNKTLNGVQRKVNSSSEEVKEVSEKIKYMEERLDKAKERVVDQEARSRRNNLIFHGVPESDREAVVRSILKEKLTEDLPYEVRQARRQLIPEMLEAKRTGKAAWLAYPARLIINGEEVKSVTPRPQPQMTA